MPYEAMNEKELPVLTVRAEIRVGEEKTVKNFTLPASDGETVSIPTPHMAAHIILRGHDFYAIKAEVLSTRIGSLLYDGRTFRVNPDEAPCRVFTYPNDEDVQEEIRLTLGILPREGK